MPDLSLRYGQEYCLTKSDLNQAAETQVDTPTWLIAVRAAEAKKATDIKVLDLTGITSFADYFVICTGANQQADPGDQRRSRPPVETPGPRTPQQRRRLHPGRMGAGRLRRPPDPHLLAQIARVLRSRTPLAQRQERRNSARVKIYLYFIGKPKDPHANAIAEDFLGRAARYSPCEMREIRPDRIDLWEQTSLRPQDLPRPRRQAPRLRRLRAPHRQSRNGRPRPRLPHRRPRRTARRLAPPRRPAASPCPP